MKINDKVPNFQFEATNGLSASISDYQGHWLILYFYPKDATPGCTTEGQEFRNAYSEFQALNAVIFGVSRDTLKSHETFKCNQTFPFELISDSDEKISRLFNVIQMKSMYGKQVLGIERSTFLISPEGMLKKEWRKVRVPGHVEEVKNTLTRLSEEANLA